MNLVKQQATFDCFLACIATIAQRPYEELFPADLRADIEARIRSPTPCRSSRPASACGPWPVAPPSRM
jgi:hypothetical protein